MRVGRGRRIGALLAIGLTALAIPSSANAAPDSEGTDFWLAIPGNYTGGGDKTLFITGRTATTGTVDIAGIGFSQNFSVTPGDVTSVALPNGSELTGSDTVQNVGIHVTAGQEVSVYPLNQIPFTTDAYLGLPTDVLGTDNIVLAWGPGQASQLAVGAPQDGTTVTITPTAQIGGHPAGTPYDVALNQGEAYQGRAGGDLSGTLITSNNPVSVYGGNQCANIPSSGFGFCDFIVEQMPPTTTWGTTIATVPLKQRTGGDTFQLVASQDGTNVAINGTNVATLNKGQVHQQLIDGQSTITSDKPILVGQYSNGRTFDGTTGDPFEMLIPPLEQFVDRHTVSTPASGFATHHINVVAPNAAVGSVTLDGSAVGSGAFTPIGSTGFSGAQLDINAGAHNLTAGGSPLGAFIYGFNQDDSYGYGGGQTFAPIATVASLTLTPPNADHVVGSEGCVTATPRTQNGTGVPDVRVDFVVTGVNPGTGFKNADASGNAVFCYTGKNGGQDTIRASVGQNSATATKTWGAGSYKENVCGFGITGKITRGTDGNDNINGTPERDLLRGLAGNDKVNGGQERDCLFGNSDNDKLTGDDGGDVIRAGRGKDKVKGNDGGDDIRLQDGEDVGKGGPGDDVIKAQGKQRRDQGGIDKVNCGSGDDKATVDRWDKVSKNCEKVKVVN